MFHHNHDPSLPRESGPPFSCHEPQPSTPNYTRSTITIIEANIFSYSSQRFQNCQISRDFSYSCLRHHVLYIPFSHWRDNSPQFPRKKRVLISPDSPAPPPHNTNHQNPKTYSNMSKFPFPALPAPANPRGSFAPVPACSLLITQSTL
jgi:hypothetical protein